MAWLATLAAFEVQRCVVIGGFSEPVQMARVVRELCWGWQLLPALLQGSWQHRLHVPAVSYACNPASQPARHAPDKLGAEGMVSPKAVPPHLSGKILGLGIRARFLFQCEHLNLLQSCLQHGIRCAGI